MPVSAINALTMTHAACPAFLDVLGPLGKDPERLLIWGGVLLAAGAAAWGVHRLIYFVLSRVLPEPKLVRYTRMPTRVLLVLFAMRVAVEAAPLLVVAFGFERLVAPDGEWFWLGQFYIVGIIVGVTWLVIGFISGADDIVLRRYRVDVRDNLVARRMHTQVRVISRTLMIIAGLLGGAAALMTFESIREFGISLLASAGIAGIILGLAARPTFENLIAGIQIALTQPIRLDDAVVVEGEWGWIESITSTYVVIKIWDERRLIVPFKRFIEQPFQNWTRTSADIIGTVFLHCDYRVSVDGLRRELKRLCANSPKWDGRVAVLQVTEAGERTVQLRALVSAADSPSAWDLRCEVREKLLAYLQSEYPEALPRIRAELGDDAADVSVQVDGQATSRSHSA